MTNGNSTGQTGCSLAFFERNRYFYGKLLTVRDFEKEQSYVNAKRQLINRLVLARGGGVVCGLEVSVDKTNVSVDPGVALDCCGREIVLDRGGSKDIKELDGFKAPESGSSTLALCLSYDECLREPVATLGNSSNCEDACDYNRIREGYKLQLKDVSAAQPAERGALWSETVTIFTDAARSITRTVQRYANPGDIIEVILAASGFEGSALTITETFDVGLTTIDGDGKIKVALQPWGKGGLRAAYLLRANDTGKIHTSELSIVPPDKLPDKLNTVTVIDGPLSDRLVQDYFAQHGQCPTCPEDICVPIALLKLTSGSTGLSIVKERVSYEHYVYNNDLLYELIAAANKRIGPIGPTGPGIEHVALTMSATGEASAELSGTGPHQTLELTLPIVTGPTGPTGPGIGSVTLSTPATGAATAALTGPAPNRTLALTIPVPPGATGPTGPGIGSVTLSTPATGAATAALTGPAPNRTLALTIPVPPGATGPTGPGIDNVSLSTPTSGTASATLSGTGPHQTLELTIPLPGAAPPVAEPLNRVIATSWHLDEVFDSDGFSSRLKLPGLVIAFERPVRIDTLHDRSVAVFVSRPETIPSIGITTRCDCMLHTEIRLVIPTERAQREVTWLVGPDTQPGLFELIVAIQPLEKAAGTTQAVQLALPDQMYNKDLLDRFLSESDELGLPRITLTVVLRGDWIMNEEGLGLLPISPKVQSAILKELTDNNRSETLARVLSEQQIFVRPDGACVREYAIEREMRWRIADVRAGATYIVHGNREPLAISISRLRPLDGNHIWPGTPEIFSGNGTPGGDWVSTLHIVRRLE